MFTPVFFIGLVAGTLFGLAVGWWARSMGKLCPACAKLLNKDAVVCEFCKINLKPAAAVSST